MMTNIRPRVLIAKTGLDGHWRGVSVVSRALRDAGFEVILIGMARADQIAAVAIQESVDLVGLNIGGRIEVVGRIVGELRAASLDVPVFAGGTISPASAKRLEELGVRAFPPGSPLSSIVDAAYELTSTEPDEVEEEVP